MAEYINKAELLAMWEKDIDTIGFLNINSYGDLVESVNELPTIDIPDTGIEFETPREQLAFICGAILEKQKRNGERRTE